MDYKERLRLAKEALESGSYDKDTIEYIFPELVQSEDENIRKEIIDILSSYEAERFRIGTYPTRNPKDYIAWLEKQGEPIDINPSEFDSRLNKLLKQFETLPKEDLESSLAFYLNVVQNNGTYKEKKQGEQKQIDYPYVTGWRRNYEGNKPQIKHSVLMLTTHGVAEGEWLGKDWCQYRWSCEIKDKDVLYWLHLSDLESLEKELIEQKSAEWCEVKENVIDKTVCWLDTLCDYLKDSSPECISDVKDIINRLKSLRPQKQQEWDKHDIEMIDWLIRCCEKEHEELCNDRYGHQDIVSDLKRDCRKKWDWLESLKGRVQPKQEWSEEDEKTIRLLIAIIETNHKEDALFKASEISPIRYLSKNEVIERIKSLRPQKQWKPSDEHMKALDIALSLAKNCGEESAFDLRTLYEQLTKLKEG